MRHSQVEANQHEYKPERARGVDCRCGWPTKVIETRKTKYAVKRRRECLNENCRERFTTKESLA
jgi:hypothetical protein